MRVLVLAIAIALGVWLWKRSQTPAQASVGGGDDMAGRILPFTLPSDVDAYIVQYSAQYGVDPDLLRAQAWQESRGKQSAKSKAGAIGVMQLMPGTAADLGVDPYDTEQNVAGGARFMSDLLSQFNGDWAKALAAYNWGPGHVSRAGEQWQEQMPSETRGYLSSIFGYLGEDWGSVNG